MLSAIPMKVMQAGENVALSELGPQADTVADGPRVSAMMVTRDRAASAVRAIYCFLAQTWTPADLVVVNDGPDSPLDDFVRQLSANDRGRIHHIRLPDNKLPLGALRNIAVESASGALVCQWDDDDLYHPERLYWQVTGLLRAGADACALWRHQILWRQSRRLCFSIRRFWEGSLLCRRDRLPRYPELRRGEDSPVTDFLAKTQRFVLLDAPELYTYIVHGANTYNADHFEEHWQFATERFIDARFDRQLRRTALSLPAPVAQSLLQIQADPPRGGPGGPPNGGA